MPTTKHRVAVNLEDKEFAELSTISEEHDVSLAWLGRRAILDFIDRHRNQQIPLPLSSRTAGSHLTKDDHAE